VSEIERPELVRKYFIPTPGTPVGAYVKLGLAGVGLLLAISAAAGDSGGWAFLLTIAVIWLAVSGGRAYFRYRRLLSQSTPKATDWQMDSWLEMAKDPIVQTGIRRLNVHPSEIGNPNHAWCLPFVGIPRIGEQPFGRRLGDDGRLRYSIYKIMVVYLSDWRLPVYTCFLDMATGATFDESTHEYALNHVGGMQTVSDRFTVHQPVNDAPANPVGSPRVIAHHTNYRAIRLMVSGQAAVELWIDVAEGERLQVEDASTVSGATHDQYIAAFREHLRSRNAGASAMNPGLTAGFAGGGPGQPGTPGPLTAQPGPLAMPPLPGAPGPAPQYPPTAPPQA
jgi:hypothetical protein